MRWFTLPACFTGDEMKKQNNEKYSKMCKAENDGEIVNIFGEDWYPLNQCPAMAERAKTQVLHFYRRLRRSSVDGKSSGFEEDGVTRHWSKPSRGAMIMANYMGTDCDATIQVMQAMEEYMVAFRDLRKAMPTPRDSETSDINPRDSTPCRSAVGELKTQMREAGTWFELLLPSLHTGNSLGVMYILRDWTTHGDEILDKNRTRICEWDPVQRRCTYDNVSLRGSRASVSVDRFGAEFKNMALIHNEATEMVYLYGHEAGGFDNGGFLCLNKNRPLALNLVSFHHGHSAFTFHKGITIKRDSEKLSALFNDGNSSKITMDSLGAETFSFACPGELVGGDEAGERGDQSSVDDIAQVVEDHHWGFVYKFADDRDAKFFPVACAGHVYDRSTVNRNLGFSLFDPTWAGQGGDTPLGNCSVHVARLIIKDILHPQVLHSLSVTNSDTVASNPVSHVIAQAAFDEIRVWVWCDICVEVCCLVVVFTCGHAAKHRKTELINPMCAVLAVFTFYFFVMLSLCVVGFHRIGKLWDYFHNRIEVLKWIFLTCRVAAIISLIDDRTRPGTDRLLLAMLGAMHWFRLIILTCGFRTSSKYILPTLQSLMGVKVFLIILLIFLGAHVQAAYMLAPRDTAFVDLIFSAYRLGLLSDFEHPKDVIWQESFDEPQEEDSVHRFPMYVLFISSSFIIAVALTNIFIGIMSNAFDYNIERMDKLFLKRRAQMCVEYQVIREVVAEYLPSARNRADNIVWYCHPMTLKKSTAAGSESSSKSMRVTLKALQHTIGKLNEDMGVVRRELHSMKNRLPQEKAHEEHTPSALHSQPAHMPSWSGPWR